MSIRFSELYNQSKIYNPKIEKIDLYIKQNENNKDFQDFMIDAIKKTCIWIHPDFYKQLPHIAPYSIRARTNSSERNKGIKDNWGGAFYGNSNNTININGFMIDDNSDIKDFVRHRRVIYQNSVCEPPKTGYIACHIWENTTQNPLLFSFIPNLVWCPKEIAKLTDDSKTFFSKHLKEISIKMYSQHTGNQKIDAIIQKSWKQIDTKNVSPDVFVLNEYCFSDQDITKRKSECLEIMKDICSIIESYKSNRPIEIKEIKHSRYVPSLREILEKNSLTCDDLYSWLKIYINSLTG